MGNSLQDQLLKAGLVTEEQAREKRRAPKGRGGRKKGGKPRRGGRSGTSPQTVRAPEKPAPLDPAAAEEARVKALNLRIRKLLDDNRVNDEKAEIVFHFTRGDRVKHVYVTESQRGALARGELAIAGFRARHHLVPVPVADEIQAMRPEVFVFRTGSDGGIAEDGVPDDLVW